MSKAYFVKVNYGITWLDVLNAVESQIKNSRKQLPYISIAEVVLEKVEFDNFITNIYHPQHILSAFAEKLQPDEYGVWKCITIKCLSNDNKILIYTAGRTIPLYVAPLLYS